MWDVIKLIIKLFYKKRDFHVSVVNEYEIIHPLVGVVNMSLMSFFHCKGFLKSYQISKKNALIFSPLNHNTLQHNSDKLLC